jgi:CheY-like chemotaxis protein
MEENKKTILLVEDENDLSDMYALAFSNIGLKVLIAVDGQKALDLLEQKYNEISLIFLDIVMPVMDGLEFLKIIKADPRFQKIKVIIFSNLDNEEDKKQAFGSGAEDYFVKTQYTPSELAEKAKMIITQDSL